MNNNILMYGYSERFGATGRTAGPDGIQWRRQNDLIKLADFQEWPKRDGVWN